MAVSRQVYPSDVSDEEWAFVVSYLTLIREDAGQRVHALRDVFDAVRKDGEGGLPGAHVARVTFRPGKWWSSKPNAGWRQAALKSWFMTYASCCACGRNAPHAPQRRSWMDALCRGSPERGGRAGYAGYKRKKGSKVHVAVDTLGNLLALLVTPANEQERAQVGALAKQVQQATQRSVKLAYVDQGYTGEKPAAEAAAHGIELEVVKLAVAKRGFVLLPRRWVVERSFAWLARFRRLARDYERLPATLAGLHWLAFTSLLLSNLFRTQT